MSRQVKTSKFSTAEKARRVVSTTVRKGWQASGEPPYFATTAPLWTPDTVRSRPVGVSGGRLVAIQNSTAGQPYVNLGLETF